MNLLYSRDNKPWESHEKVLSDSSRSDMEGVRREGQPTLTRSRASRMLESRLGQAAEGTGKRGVE